MLIERHRHLGAAPYQRAAAPEGTRACFYRTTAGAETDLVLDLPGGELWAIEIKRGLAPRLSHGFHDAIADLKPIRELGGLYRAGSVSAGIGTGAIPLPELMSLLRAVAKP